MKIEQLLNALQSCLDTENWYAALVLVLTIPDICSKIESPQIPGSKRYPDWFDKYVAHKYFKEDKQLLSGRDCYALRCSILHEWKTDISKQKIQETLENFSISTSPSAKFKFHLNYDPENQKLFIQLDIFCKDVMQGVSEWFKTISPRTLLTYDAIDIKEIPMSFVDKLGEVLREKFPSVDSET